MHAPLPTAGPDADFLSFQSAVAGQYSLERELGRGGMGIVYLAREVQLDRLVAIKLLPPVLAARADLRERFLREARTSAKLSHPNIVPIYRADQVGSYVFFVMAYVDGETLTGRVRGRGPLTVPVATKLLQEISWALAYAHARGIVHRDIKPDNILIESGSGRALVTDFGIAQVTDGAQLTEAGSVVGTAQYMSPEQAAGEMIDGRSDLYSLGVVAHFALTAKLPFDGPTVQSVLAKHLTQAPPSIASVSPSVPRALAAAVDRCLAKDPSLRFASGESLAEAVGSAASSSPELPIALRVWLTRRVPMYPLYLGWSALFGVSALIATIAKVIPGGPHSSGVITGYVLTLLGLAPITLSRLIQTRRALSAGYTLDDLRLALQQHTEREREETEFDPGRKPTLFGRILRVIAYGSLLGDALITASAFHTPFILRASVAINAFGILAGVSMGTALLGVSFPGREVRPGRFAELRFRFWNSKLGALFAGVAGLRLQRGASTVVIHRPTEMAIGLAADDLFNALPEATRDKLRDLPETVRRLEKDAQTMRKRIEELNASIAASQGAVGSAGSAVNAHRDAVVADLTAARDVASKRLGTAVAALETIRLDLLRLQAGAGSVAALTGAIESARRIGAEIDNAVAGRMIADAVAPPTPVTPH